MIICNFFGSGYAGLGDLHKENVGLIQEADRMVSDLAKENKDLIEETRKEDKERAQEIVALVKDLKDESAKRATAWKESLRIIQAGKKEIGAK